MARNTSTTVTKIALITVNIGTGMWKYKAMVDTDKKNDTRLRYRSPLLCHLVGLRAIVITKTAPTKLKLINEGKNRELRIISRSSCAIAQL